MDPLRSAEAQGVEFALLSHTVGHSIQFRVFWQCTPQTLTKPITTSRGIVRIHVCTHDVAKRGILRIHPWLKTKRAAPTRRPPPRGCTLVRRRAPHRIINRNSCSFL